MGVYQNCFLAGFTGGGGVLSESETRQLRAVEIIRQPCGSYLYCGNNLITQ